MTTDSSNYWAVIPAAGVGKRMDSESPKQYLPLAGQIVLEHTLQRLLDHHRIAGVVIALGDHDAYWSQVCIESDKPVLMVSGGQERCDSVFNALDKLMSLSTNTANPHGVSVDDWVLVHDAARPCVRAGDIDRLINTVEGDRNGGLLALPVRDTMKRQGQHQQVSETVDRNGLWHALTPQLFQLKVLHQALIDAINAGVAITDESSAMEYAGYHPLLVEGHEDNIKITRPPDLKLAELYLNNQRNER